MIRCLFMFFLSFLCIDDACFGLNRMMSYLSNMFTASHYGGREEISNVAKLSAKCIALENNFNQAVVRWSRDTNDAKLKEGVQKCAEALYIQTNNEPNTELATALITRTSFTVDIVDIITSNEKPSSKRDIEMLNSYARIHNGKIGVLDLYSIIGR